VPAAKQVPALGQETLTMKDALGTKASAGRGAFVAVHVPPERERRTPF
jgi:hypothetical protein